MLVQSDVFRRPDIEGAAGVMLAVTRCGHETKDVRDALAGGKFLADDDGLPAHAAKTRKREQDDTVLRRGFPHVPPRGGGQRCKANVFAVVGRATDGHKVRCFAQRSQAARASVVGWDTERVVQVTKAGRRHRMNMARDDSTGQSAVFRCDRISLFSVQHSLHVCRLASCPAGRKPSALNIHEMKAGQLHYLLLRGDPRFKALLNDPTNNAPLF